MSGAKLILDYFGTTDRRVSMDEMKALTTAERKELADAIAKERNLTAHVTDGLIDYK